MAEIIGLTLLALVLASFEILVPGGILGILAVVSLALASYLAYEPFGLGGSVLLFMGGGVTILVVVYFEFKLLGKTRFRNRFILSSAVTGRSESVHATEEVINAEGVTLTAMAPTGMILINDQKFEAFSRSGFLPKNQSIRVVARDNFRLIIEKI
jgi:membrane-bound serine protease (ClpP class)